MAFAIMRATKLKTFGSISGSLKHTYREQDTPNADRARLHENIHECADNSNRAMALIRQRTDGLKVRKDAIRAIEYLFTASHDWSGWSDKSKTMDFFGECKEWLIDKYGRDNLVVFTVHNDELTPHVTAMVVPRTADNRLSAKEFIGNAKQMSADQSSFYDRVKRFGDLERGIIGSKAEHKTMQQMYTLSAQERQRQSAITADVYEEFKPQKINKFGIPWRRETADEIANRVATKIQPLTATAEKLAHERSELTTELEKFQREQRLQRDRERSLTEREHTLDQRLQDGIRSATDTIMQTIRKQDEQITQLKRENLTLRNDLQLEQTKRKNLRSWVKDKDPDIFEIRSYEEHIKELKKQKVR